MEWKTNISKSSEEETLIRGYPLVDLIGRYTFTETIYLILKGELPRERHTKMLDAIFAASIDHGVNPPSAMAARIIASCGSDFNDALSAGLLAIGQHHGGAVERSARILQEQEEVPAAEIVRSIRAAKQRLPGYGHKIYTVDPRAEKLISIAKELGFSGRYVEKAREIEDELGRQTGKRLCLNVDGTIAAIISELGFSWKMAQAFFIIPRIAGLSAHVAEEMQQSTTYRRLETDSVNYTGPERRDVPLKD